MSFTHSAFIRKNTPELRKKLEELGYYKMSENRIESDNITITTYQNGWYNLSYSNESNIAINCGTNEPLFLAIAALRDDSDYMQWFYSTGWTDNKGAPLPDKWVLCDQKTLEHFGWVNNSPNTYKLSIWKKADPSELIEHFQKDTKTGDHPKCTLTDGQLKDKCADWIDKLCKSGGQAWTLRVPVDFNTDPDILFNELICRHNSLSSENALLKEALKEVSDELGKVFLDWYPYDDEKEIHHIGGIIDRTKQLLSDAEQKQ